MNKIQEIYFTLVFTGMTVNVANTNGVKLKGQIVWDDNHRTRYENQKEIIEQIESRLGLKRGRIVLGLGDSPRDTKTQAIIPGGSLTAKLEKIFWDNYAKKETFLLFWARGFPETGARRK